jgi:hypothetical protein
MPIVSDNLFLEAASPPDAAAIEAALGEAYAWYQGVLNAAAGFMQDWKHYGKKYGWKLKAHDGAKALFELTVARGNFRLGMAVRERELEAMREDEALASELGGLLDADKAKEGWGIRLTIDEEGKYRQALRLIEAVAALRRKD